MAEQQKPQTADELGLMGGLSHPKHRCTGLDYETPAQPIAGGDYAGANLVKTGR